MRSPVAKQSVLTPQAEDFPRWYQDILAKAELAENGPVRGTMVIRPYGYAIWERVQSEIDARIKAAGAKNAYFPLFIPESYLKREAEHVEGFSPELAVVTHAGGEKLAEPVVVRPTSETVIGEYMAKWIQSYRDLPLLLNQWANVVRWELRPRLFLRTSEFLWQEGHTAHADQADASAYARRIHLEVYHDFLENILAMPTFLGMKSPGERFAGAVNTMTCEGMMGDGKALQMATSHELGQNFAKAFDIKYLGDDSQEHFCFTTSWGASSRLIGGLIMGHGDDDGLIVPPRLAPVQTIILCIRDEPELTEVARTLSAELSAAGIRNEIDARSGSFGRRITDWELKGVPTRIEIGPRDLADGNVTLARRDDATKETVALSAVVGATTSALDEVQRSLFERARTRRDVNTFDVATLEEAIDAGQRGFARLSWSKVGVEGEAALKRHALTVRCVQRSDGTIPENDGEADLVCIVARSY